MKRKILSIIFGILSLILLQKFSISNKAFYVDVTLENIDALAGQEGGLKTIDCYESIHEIGPNGLTHVTYCGSCKARLARDWWDKSTCYE